MRYKGTMQRCGVCKETVKCDETDKESRKLFKEDFPWDDYEDSEYVCWDCYNKAMKRKTQTLNNTKEEEN